MPARTPKTREGQAPPKLPRIEFRARFSQQFADPLYAPAAASVRELEALAHRAYDEGRKAPVTRKAGPGCADPDYELSIEWLGTRDRLLAAARTQRRIAGRSAERFAGGGQRDPRVARRPTGTARRFTHAGTQEVAPTIRSRRHRP